MTFKEQNRFMSLLFADRVSFKKMSEMARALPRLITLCNVCAVPWEVLSTGGVFSTVGDIMSTVGDILSTVGVQYRGGYHDKCGDILSTVGYPPRYS